MGTIEPYNYPTQPTSTNSSSFTGVYYVRTTKNCDCKKLDRNFMKDAREVQNQKRVRSQQNRLFQLQMKNHK